MTGFEATSLLWSISGVFFGFWAMRDYPNMRQRAIGARGRTLGKHVLVLGVLFFADSSLGAAVSAYGNDHSAVFVITALTFATHVGLAVEFVRTYGWE